MIISWKNRMAHVYILVIDSPDNTEASECISGVFRHRRDAKQAMREYVRENYAEGEQTKFLNDWRKNYDDGVYDMGDGAGYLKIVKEFIKGAKPP